MPLRLARATLGVIDAAEVAEDDSQVSEHHAVETAIARGAVLLEGRLEARAGRFHVPAFATQVSEPAQRDALGPGVPGAPRQPQRRLVVLGRLRRVPGAPLRSG